MLSVLRRSFMKKRVLFVFAKVVLDISVSFAIFSASFFALGFYSNGNQIFISFLVSFIYALLLCILLFGIKVYKPICRYLSFIDLLKISLVSFFASILLYFVFYLIPFEHIKTNWNLFYIPVLFSFSLSAILCVHRLIPNIMIFINYQKSRKHKIKTIVIGAGGAGKMIVDDVIKNESNKHNVVAFLDDDKAKIGSSYFGVKVFGPISSAKAIISKYSVEEVIIAINEINHNRLNEILSYLADTNVRVRRMPILTELNGPNDSRIINIDLNDLLGREPIKLSNSKVSDMVYMKTVLITGAGGSIGSELVRQVFSKKPKTIILFDIYENSTYDIQMELFQKQRSDESYKGIAIVTLIGATYDEIRVEHVLKKYRPDYIFHAAAYKHVPLMEDSPEEAIRTNVIGTYNVARLADKYLVKKMVLISTDKAVRPTNVMGATKRFAETIVQYFSTFSKHTSYAAVRFGNVLGSNGSVVPLFKKQIESGGPITLTHKDIIRYFMTIPEAVSLILECGSFANGGEIFILDMGKPVKILDLAERMIKQFGLVPYVDIQIVETGLRPGEKLYEELLLDTSKQTKTANNKIFIEKKEAVFPIEDEIKLIKTAFDMENATDIKELLSSIIKTYKITTNE